VRVHEIESAIADLEVETLGFDTMLAEDAERGSAALESADPDLLLLDVAMPGMNGGQMTESVRAKRPDLPSSSRAGIPRPRPSSARSGRPPRC
jgi:CheY-like chemotaxis protein